MSSVQPAVSFIVSFIYVLNRLSNTTQNLLPKSRIVFTYAGPSPTDLESVGGQQSLTTGPRATE